MMNFVKGALGRAHLIGLCSAVGLISATLAFAGLEEELESELLPIPSLFRPATKSPPKSQDSENKVRARNPQNACAEAVLGGMTETLGFGPGEILQFDVTMVGIRTGGITMRFGEKTHMDRLPVYPIQVHAKTEGVFSLLGNIDGRMISYVSPASILPTRMVNRFLVEKPFSEPTLTKEDAVFLDNGKILGHLSYKKKDKKKAWPISRRAGTDLVDVVSIVYYSRSRLMTEAEKFCFEIYHRRVLYLVEGQIGGIETVRTPIGLIQAHRVDVQLRRKRGSSKASARQVTVWLSADDRRLPVLVQTPEKVGNLQVRLKAWLPGHRLVPRWTTSR
jgi:hypothetical protein